MNSNRRLPRLAHTVVLGLAVILLTESAARLTLSLLRSLPDPRARADGYREAEWTADYFRELTAAPVEWRSYVYWRHKPFEGDHISIDSEGLRRTWNSPETAGSPKVFAFGGSTVWGIGARDGATWPSTLSRLRAEAGRAVEVVNLGEHGYVTAQDLLGLIDRLERGQVPTVAVFYGGASDVFAALQSGRGGLPQNELNRVAEFNITQPTSLRGLRPVLLSGLLRLTAGLRASDNRTVDLPQLSDAVAKHYVSRVRAARALAREYGFRVLFLWQPLVHTKKMRSAYEERQRARFEELAPLYDAVRANVAGDPSIAGHADWFDLSGVFASEPAPLYIDALHLTEEGYTRVAAAVARLIDP